MKKMYVTLLLLAAACNLAFGLTDATFNTDDTFYDPCKFFKMDSAEELKMLLEDNGFAYYDEQTDISEKLANKTLSPFGVFNQVISCNYDFYEYMKNDEIAVTQTRESTPDIIETLLTNHPEAIECLRQNKILE